MKAFVTGSTGLLGSNLVHALIEQGHEVKALIRSSDKATKVLGDLNVEFVNGDMRDVVSFAHHLAGCEALFHTAAYFREYYQPGQHQNLMHEINVAGTITLFEAAVTHHVKNVIYVSSGGVLDTGATEGPADESAPYNYRTPNQYFKSKIAAEEAIYTFLETNDIRIIFILPGVMLGPRDSGPTSSGQFIIDFLNKRVPGILPGGLSFVDARDVAQAMIRALGTGQSGERYLVGGVITTCKPFSKCSKTCPACRGLDGISLILWRWLLPGFQNR